MAAIMAALSTSVDLSRLPAPVIVEQIDVATIRAAMIADLQAIGAGFDTLDLESSGLGFDAFVASDPAIKVLEVAAYREQLLRAAFNDAARQLLIAYASGSMLDNLAALVGVERLTVTAADPFTGSAAVMESDDALRQRVVLAPEALASAGPELAYVAHAKSASADILDASATSPAPGKILVSVLARAGDGTARPALIAAVAAIVTDRSVRPLGDDVTVASAIVVPFVVDAVLTTFSGPDSAVVIAAARASLDTFLAENRLLGRSIRTAGIIAALKVAGVENVVLRGWQGDVLCEATEAGICTSAAITHGGYAE